MQAFTHLENQIRECFGRVVYTHKTHEKAADLCAQTLARLKLGQVALSALSSSGVLVIVFTDQPPFSLKAITAILSLASLWITGYMKGFDPGGSAQKHRDAAASLWPIRESYLSLLTDLRMQAISEVLAAGRRDELQAMLAAIYKGAPQTNSAAYSLAQTALQDNEEYTFCDDEIDAFVPASLRKKQPEIQHGPREGP